MSARRPATDVHPVASDVIALKPKAVVILAGTNDIAGNTGRSMAEQNKEAGIEEALNKRRLSAEMPEAIEHAE